MIQFYAPEIESTLTLPQPESLHCVKVLRKREGDEITVTDGRGTRFLCLLTMADPRGAMVEIIKREKVANHWPVRIELAVAPSKNIDRMEWFVEKAVEIGVNRIMMIKCQRSERKSVNIERLQKIAVSAMNQSLKTVLPEIVEMTDIKDLMMTRFEGQKFFGYCSDEVYRKEFIHEYRKDSDVLIMIGPEGDFSQDEVEYAIENGFMPVTFGKSRLRTETAALFAVQAVHILNSL